MGKLDEVLELLDGISPSTENPFKNEIEKEKYESNLMFIFRRNEAAKYYLKKVSEIIDKEKNTSPESRSVNEHSYVTTISISKTNSSIFNEFVSFLSAIRSGLDFLSKFVIRHIKGIKGDSLTTLFKLLDKNKSNLILEVISEHKEWLKFIKDYRDKLIHNFSHLIYLGKKEYYEDGNRSVLFYPVLVPSSIPQFEYDTRLSRSMFEIDTKYMREEWRIERPSPEGITVESGKRVLPADGYVEIVEFMTIQCGKFDSLFSEFLDVLIKIELKIIELETRAA